MNWIPEQVIVIYNMYVGDPCISMSKIVAVATELLAISCLRKEGF